MSLQPRPEIADLKVSQHGGLNYAELEAMGISPDEVLDFSVSSNPHGPPPGLVAATKDARIDRYPDSEASELRHRLGRRLRVDPRNIIVGSGSTELIRLAALAYLGRDDKALIIEPTFGEYEVACHIMGAAIVRQRLSDRDGFALDMDMTQELMRRHRPRVVFLCNPNNPTGSYLSRQEFQRLLAAAPDSLVILDEAYIAFVPETWPSTDMIEDNNLLILRSMTKDYTLAGLRLGYAVAHQEIVDTLRRVCPPWNVNAVAQQAGVFALQQEEFSRRTRIQVSQAKAYLVRELTRLGLRPLPSRTNFFLVEVGDASDWRRRLLKKGILVRDCTSFGLPHHVRIAPRDFMACSRLVAAIKELQREEPDAG